MIIAYLLRHKNRMIQVSQTAKQKSGASKTEQWSIRHAQCRALTDARLTASYRQITLAELNVDTVWIV